MKDIISAHFELLLLAFIFVFGCLMLAKFPGDELARWIENGAIVTIIARSMGGNKAQPPTSPETPVTTNENKTT